MSNICRVKWSARVWCTWCRVWRVVPAERKRCRTCNGLLTWKKED